MNGLQILKSALIGGASAFALANPAAAKVYDIPEGDLSAALFAYMTQSNVEIYYADDVVRGHTSHGVKGDLTETAALTQILRGTGFTTLATSTNAIQIVPAPREPKPRAETIRVAAAATRTPTAGAVETVVVTAQKKSENIQNVPIAVTALSQAQLTARQIAGGPDLLRDVPNMDFTKTNFSGYDIELRGIGTQAISVTTDPAVAVAFNGTPFIRNHFFEQEFYDLQDVEVLLGPQGTLYGRNATAGVVNLKSALPDDSYQAMLSADMGNHSNRRLEGMLNVPIVGDKLDLRIAGEWTKRDGYSIDTTYGSPIDGRDLWSTRVTLGWKPIDNLQAYFVWEHFSEDDDRLRSGKQLCKTDPDPNEVDGVGLAGSFAVPYEAALYLSQGCSPTSLYSKDAFQVPNGISLPYYEPFGLEGVPIPNEIFDPYASTTQSTNLRQIQSQLLPTYRAKNDTLELNADYQISPTLTLTSQTGYNHDFLWSTEDYNRFDTAPGAFTVSPPVTTPDPSGLGTCSQTYGSCNVGAVCQPPGPGNVCNPYGVFCDPQLGCSNRLVAEDLDEERAWQLSQEFRLASNFSGPLNFSVGGNLLHYETEENYYVFINSLTLASYTWSHGGTNSPTQTLPWIPGVSDNSNCLAGGFAPVNLNKPNRLATEGETACIYIDPNPIGSLNNEGHNYFLSQNPYVLNSYAGFGEAYYKIAPDLKLTTGIRWTDDQKHFLDIPSEVVVPGIGYPISRVVNQSWERFTGRAVLDWTPQLDFTDQTLVYASYAHGYKAGGANPPGAQLLVFSGEGITTPIHPITFKPEYIEAFEFGTKNTLLDSSLTLNGDIFYYNYTGYQISEIVDRTAINNNYNAHVEGAEVTANWEPVPGLKFNFAGGWEDTAAAGGDQGIDLMDRADVAQHPDWIVVKPFPTQASNCILPTYVVAAIMASDPNQAGPNGISGACSNAYQYGLDPLTVLPYVVNPTTINVGGSFIPTGYPGFNPATAPNNGEGFNKNLSGHALPNAPPFTVSLGGEYSIPVSDDWVATLRSDFYWQADSWARIFNDNPYDRIHGYTNLNLALILSSANGWQVMGYIKNVLNTTAITGDFLNSDDTGLTTNVFLTDPRLFGVRVTKQLDEGDGFWGSDYSGADFFTGLFSDKDGGKPELWIELGADEQHIGGQGDLFTPAFLAGNVPNPTDPYLSFFPPGSYSYGPPLTFSVLRKGTTPVQAQEPRLLNFGEEARVSFEPEDSDWVISGAIRFGQSNDFKEIDHQTNGVFRTAYKYGVPVASENPRGIDNFADTSVHHKESHTIIDFMVGKDMGLGRFGLDGSSILSGGVRIAQLSTDESFDIRARPDLQFKYQNFAAFGAPGVTLKLPFFETNHATGQAKRSFHGVGPTLSWNGSAPVVGNLQDGEATLDWGANVALLFGRQRTHVRHHESAHYVKPTFVETGYYFTAYDNPPGGHTTNRTVTVPNLGGFAGISYRYANAKISLGYRADFFFGAIDGGIDKRKSETLNMSGPFATISFGLGG